ncbi:MAG: hypothetical protein Q9225_007448 [Loekoesia sp. 1 TL-2023]
MDDSTLSHYDPIWDQLMPNGPDTSFTDFNTALDSFPTARNGPTFDRPDFAFSPFPSNPHTNNHRRIEHLRRNQRSSANPINVNPSSSNNQPSRTYYEPTPEPLSELHSHHRQQQPADTAAFDFSFAQEPQPSQPNQSLRLPGIDTITQDLTAADRPASRFSWDSAGGDSLFADTNFWPDFDYSNLNDTLDANGFVDLTADSSPPNIMPPATRKRRASALATPTPSSPAPVRTNKRRKTSDPAVKDEEETKVEHLDLLDVDDDKGLSQVLEQQQAAAIKEQQGKQGDQPTKLSTLQCIICMESMTDITVTHCGHLFCHTCIMEALIAGENQGEPGKATSKCPVCRKKVSRPKEKSRDKREVIPLEIKCLTKSSLAKGKAKAKA